MVIHRSPQAIGVQRRKHISAWGTIGRTRLSAVNRLGVAAEARIDPEKDRQISISDAN
jgi:hypothetical protein